MFSIYNYANKIVDCVADDIHIWTKFIPLERRRRATVPTIVGSTSQLKTFYSRNEKNTVFGTKYFFIQYNLPLLQYTYSNDLPKILCHPYNDFPEALQNTRLRL